VTQHRNWFAAGGALALSLGLMLRLSTHGNFSHFASGFFVGMSIALLIRGLARQTRGILR
jgi:hypothetical protein